MKTKKVVSILDYGAGNIYSVCHALRYLSYPFKIISSVAELQASECLIVPGQGAFSSAMQSLHQQGFVDALRTYILAERPYFGICLGFQILFSSSEEHGGAAGLNIYNHALKRFDDSDGVVPHMGWNQLLINNSKWDKDLGFKDPYVYFIHSFYLPFCDSNLVFSKSCYGVEFVSAIQQGHLFATQFHPEKSGKFGLQLMDHYLRSL